ncbi:hypothetical protein HMPREF9413_1527, partial [Paenibacillus sp. HGF7]
MRFITFEFSLCHVKQFLLGIKFKLNFILSAFVLCNDFFCNSS